MSFSFGEPREITAAQISVPATFSSEFSEGVSFVVHCVYTLGHLLNLILRPKVTLKTLKYLTAANLSLSLKSLPNDSARPPSFSFLFFQLQFYA